MTEMKPINLKVPATLHARAKAHPFMSINALATLGLEWAVQHYSNLYSPGEIGAATAPLRAVESKLKVAAPVTANPAPTSTPAKRVSLDPITDHLKPWTDGRGHTWFNLAGFLTYLGLTRADIEPILDMAEDIDRDNDDAEILDRAAIERIFTNLPGAKYPSMDRYHALNSWLDARG